MSIAQSNLFQVLGAMFKPSPRWRRAWRISKGSNNAKLNCIGLRQQLSSPGSPLLQSERGETVRIVLLSPKVFNYPILTKLSGFQVCSKKASSVRVWCGHQRLGVEAFLPDRQNVSSCAECSPAASLVSLAESVQSVRADALRIQMRRAASTKPPVIMPSR